MRACALELNWSGVEELLEVSFGWSRSKMRLSLIYVLCRLVHLSKKLSSIFVFQSNYSPLSLPDQFYHLSLAHVFKMANGWALQLMLKQGDLPSETALYYSTIALIHSTRPERAQRLMDAMVKRGIVPAATTLRLLCFRLDFLGKSDKAESALELGRRLHGDDGMFKGDDGRYGSSGESSGVGLISARSLWLVKMGKYEKLREHLELCENMLGAKGPNQPLLFRVYNGVVNFVLSKVCKHVSEGYQLLNHTVCSRHRLFDRSD
jgi:hypothetical protein